MSFFADDLAQLVSLAGGESCQSHGDLSDLFLIDSQTVGFAEDWFQKGMKMTPGFAVHAGNEFANEIVGGRPNDGRCHDQMLEQGVLSG